MAMELFVSETHHNTQTHQNISILTANPTSYGFRFSVRQFPSPTHYTHYFTASFPYYSTTSYFSNQIIIPKTFTHFPTTFMHSQVEGFLNY